MYTLFLLEFVDGKMSWFVSHLTGKFHTFSALSLENQLNSQRILLWIVDVCVCVRSLFAFKMFCWPIDIVWIIGFTFQKRVLFILCLPFNAFTLSFLSLTLSPFAIRLCGIGWNKINTYGCCFCCMAYSYPFTTKSQSFFSPIRTLLLVGFFEFQVAYHTTTTPTKHVIIMIIHQNRKMNVSAKYFDFKVDALAFILESIDLTFLICCDVNDDKLWVKW